MFWILAGLLVVIVVAVLLAPLRRAPRLIATRSEYDINVYKDQLTELERDLAEGRIAESEAAAARLEIQRRLLAAADSAGAEKPADAGSGTGTWAVVTAAVVVPIAAAAFYFQTGTPGMPDFPLAGRADIRSATTAVGAEDKTIRALAARLEARLRENPEDATGWTMLGRTYANIGEPRAAAAAYQRAVELAGRDPALLADWAEARLLARDGGFTPEIFGDFLEARESDPMLPKPWFYIGLDKAMGGDFEGAAQIWTDLLAIQPTDATFAASIHAQIARAAEEGGFSATDLKPSATAQALIAGRAAPIPGKAPASEATPAEPTAPGPSREDVEAAQQLTPEERMAFIRSMVERLAGKLEENPNDRAGWERLIRAYDVLGETEKAAQARDRLKGLTVQ
jgi:cytochrome c-type biogenesis protein CcmH